MAKSKDQTNLCPVTFALDVFGDRWTLLILRDILIFHRYTYKGFKQANPGIATNVLADRLKRLETRKLIEKNRDPNDARQFLYKPTSLAISVIPMLVEMIVWGAKQGKTNVSEEFLKRFEEDRGALIEELQEEAQTTGGQ